MKKFLASIYEKKGKPKGWPGCFNYDITNDRLFIEMPVSDKRYYKMIDAWGLALLSYANEEFSKKFDLEIIIKEDKNKFSYMLEALRRRLSYLDINNSFNITLTSGNYTIKLYDEEELYNRKDKGEIVHTDFDVRSDQDVPGRLEKDLQTFLFGKNLEKEKRTNERLAILGEDFYNLNSKEIGIIREFPTGVFINDIKEKNRVLPTEYVDIVTLNKKGDLAIIELKLNNANLEVISQSLNYVLHFRCYLDQLFPLLKKKLGYSKNKKIICYFVNNHFHPKLDGIFKYYKNKSTKYPFEIKMVTLGHYKQI